MSDTLSSTAAPGATAPAAGDTVAILNTAHGRIVVKFFADHAPKHAAAFQKLVTEGFYDGIRFHRVIPGFMIQGGCPNSRDADNRSAHGTGGPGYKLAQEFNEIKHTPGILSAARTSDPNSAGSQFFLMHNSYPSLDGQYSVFGQVIEGMDVVESIVHLERDHRDNPKSHEASQISSATLATWPLES